MKKNYVKPQLWKELFQPADAIAGNCTLDVGFGDGGELGAKACASVEDGNLFVTSIQNGGPCEYAWKDEHDGLCYHSAQGAEGYFGS